VVHLPTKSIDVKCISDAEVQNLAKKKLLQTLYDLLGCDEQGSLASSAASVGLSFYSAGAILWQQVQE